MDGTYSGLQKCLNESETKDPVQYPWHLESTLCKTTPPLEPCPGGATRIMSAAGLLMWERRGATRVMSAAGLLMWERSGAGLEEGTGGNGEATTREDG